MPAEFAVGCGLLPKKVSVDRRIYNHPVLTFRRGRKVTIYLGDEPLQAFEGEPIAAALYASGHEVLRLSPKYGRPRSVFCMVGKCGSCLMKVNGIPVRTCLTPVSEGVRVNVIEDLPELPGLEESKVLDKVGFEELDTDVLVVGGGPAGLAATEVIAPRGLSVTLVDDQLRLGGQLIKQTHRFFGSKELFAGLRGYQIAEAYESKIRKFSNVKVFLRTTATGVFTEGVLLVNEFEGKAYLVRAKSYLIATGAFENYLAFNNNDLPGVMGAGGAQTLMNVYGVRPGDKVLVVGAGNVGLIISYQLLQAGSEVVAILEAMPKIGGWFVHAAKVRRYGVPILTRHTIKEALGERRVEGAVVVKLDESWRPIEGTERTVECDTVLLSVGLTPNVELLRQFGVRFRYIPELGGLVALRTKYMETTTPGVFIAGDLAGIEEATTAFIEGWIAGYSILIRHLGERKEFIKAREEYVRLLEDYRRAPVSEKVRRGWSKALINSGEVN